MRLHKGVLAGALIAGAAVIAVAHRAISVSTPVAAHPATGATTTQVTSSADLDELKSEVAGLRAALDDRKPEAPGPRADNTSPPPAGHGRPGASAQPPAAPPTPDELREMEVDRMRRFDDIATNEPRDGAWATTSEDALRGAVQAAAPGATIDGLSCRTSLCRLELSTPSRQAADALLLGLRGQLPPMAGAHWSMEQASDGSTRTTLDLVREGYPMPGAAD